MKKIASLALAFALVSPMAQAATLLSGDTTNGISSVSGAGLASGTIRWGTFSTGFDFATNASNLSALESAFTAVVTYSGAINAFSINGFFEPGELSADMSYNEAGTFGSIPYDLSGDTSNVGGDIAGSLIYAWVQNSGQTEQAVFSSGQTWVDGNTVPVNNSAFSWETTTGAGVTAHIGTLLAGPDLGGGNASHQLAAVPEPSRAVLGFLGLGALFFRRRR